MELRAPFMITSRLMAGVKIGDGYVSIEYAGIGSNGRLRYRYVIDVPGVDEFYSCSDLESGVGRGSIQGGMESLLGFLGAAAEAYRYEMNGRESGNGDLFPKHVMEWAYQHDDEISMVLHDVEETEDCCIE